MVKSATVPFAVSPGEADLIEAIRKVQFGELYGVEIDQNEGRWVEHEIAPAIRDLLLYLRSGVQSIDILTVHHGQPIQAETDCVLWGFRCRKKVRFPTVSTEG